MANISKHTFDRCVCYETPCSVFHPWNSHCTKGIGIFVCNVLFGSSKFFLPIYIVKLMLNYKKINRKYIKDQLSAYLRSICYGMVYGALFMTSSCLISKVHLNYYFPFQAGFVGGLSLLVESTENKNIDKILYFNQLIEILINALSSAKIITRTRCTETVAFMFVTSSLMYLFKIRVRRLKVPILWFYTEKSIYQPDAAINGLSLEETCNHKQSCTDYSLEGAYSYFLVGYLLEIIRKLLPKMFEYVRNPLLIRKLLFHKDNIMMGLFLGGFVTLYRLICCYLRKKEHKEVPSHALIAAFIASSTYCLKPNIQMLIIALTSVLQLLWERCTIHFNLPRVIPYSQILFCLSSGMLIQCRFTTPDQCPGYVKNMTDIATNNMASLIYTQFLKHIRETEKYLDSLGGL